jgi:hypothetical protein
LTSSERAICDRHRGAKALAEHRAKELAAHITVSIRILNFTQSRAQKAINRGGGVGSFQRLLSSTPESGEGSHVCGYRGSKTREHSQSIGKNEELL